MNGTVTPSTDRKLLADVHRWARTNGWTWNSAWCWQNATYATEATLAVEWDLDARTVIVRRGDGVVFRPTTYPADTVREAVDLLVAIGILPARFARAYQAGVTAGFDMALELAATEVTR